MVDQSLRNGSLTRSPSWSLVARLIQIISRYFNANRSHGLEHCLRVMSYARLIGSRLNLELEPLQIAALLHDAESGLRSRVRFPRNSHAYRSALIAAGLLGKLGYPRSQQVFRMILSHGATLKLSWMLRLIGIGVFLRGGLLKLLNQLPLDVLCKYPPRDVYQQVIWDADTLDLLNLDSRGIREELGILYGFGLKFCRWLVDFGMAHLHTAPAKQLAFLESLVKFSSRF